MIRAERPVPVLGRFVADLEGDSPRPIDVEAFDRSGYSTVDLQTARLAWAGRVVDEYRSVVVFTELFAKLAEISAPYSALAAVQRLIADELRHSHLCARLAEAIGGIDDLDIDLSDLGLPPGDDPPAGRALEIVVRELVVAETESVVVLRAYRDAATDPTARTALSILLHDEARHAACGRALCAMLVARYPREAFGEVPDRLEVTAAGDRAHIRRAYLASADGGPGRALGASLWANELPYHATEL